MLGDQKRYPAGYAETEIYVDTKNAHDIQGILYHPATKVGWKYEGISELIGIYEELFNEMQFPQATHRIRGLGRENEVKRMRENEVKEEMLKDAKPTFVVKIRYRQNATWQGTVQWVEGNKTKNFRSALELIRLLDEAVGDGEEKENWDQ